MSRRLFIFLAAIELSLTGCMPKLDLSIHIFNGTSQQIEVCNSARTSCRKTAAGDTMRTFYATEGHADKVYGEWLLEWTVTACGKTIHMKDATEKKDVVKDFWSKTTTYSLALRNDVVTQACSGGSVPEALSASK